MRKFIASAVLALTVATAVLIAVTDQPAPCTTDSECLLLCEPADAECDGGPSSAE